jgi:hypothetical protein
MLASPKICVPLALYTITNSTSPAYVLLSSYKVVCNRDPGCHHIHIIYCFY